MTFFALNTWVLGTVLLAVIAGATALGHVVGRSVRERSHELSEPFAVMQATMLGFMGLVLAFGLSLAVGRYESPRAAVADESNAIARPTSGLRRSPRRTARGRCCSSSSSPMRASASPRRCPAVRSRTARSWSSAVESRLWAEAGQAVDREPTASSVRLYVESLNEMFDAQSSRVYGLRNPVPTAVLIVEIFGAAIALGLLALHLATLGRGVATVMVAAGLVTVMLVITFDLDRPVRGLIQVSATPLTGVLRPRSALTHQTGQASAALTSAAPHPRRPEEGGGADQAATFCVQPSFVPYGKTQLLTLSKLFADRATGEPKVGGFAGLRNNDGTVSYQ